MGIGRNRQGERRSRSRLTPQPDGSVVIGGDVLDDRQAESGAAGGTRTCLVYAEEPLEYALLILAGDADAAVGDGDLDVVASATAADRHWRAIGRVCDCVGHQVGNRRHEQRLVT